jgi:hypothetical protein
VNYFPTCGGGINDSTVLLATGVLKYPLSLVEIGLIYSRKLISNQGKIYRATADPIDESLHFSPVTRLAALELPKANLHNQRYVIFLL